MKALLLAVALVGAPVAAWAVCPVIDPACANASRMIGSPYEPNGLKPPPTAPGALANPPIPATPGLYRPPSYQSQAVARPYVAGAAALQPIHPIPGSVNDPAGVSAPAGEHLYAPPQD